MIADIQSERQGLWHRFADVIAWSAPRAETVQYRATPVQQRTLGARIDTWMRTQEQRTGKRPTYAAAGKHFGCHRTTISRNLKKYRGQA